VFFLLKIKGDSMVKIKY